MNGLADLMGLGETALAAWLLVFLRVGAAMALLPAFGEQAVPARIRLGLTLCFAAIVAPAAGPDIATRLDQGLRVLPAAAAEVAAGLALGIGLRLMVHALQIAGTIAGNMMSLSHLLGGAGVDPQPAMGQVLVLGGLALAALLGLHVKIALAFLGSYAVMPPGLLPGAGELAGWGTARIAEAFSLAFVLAAPFTIAALLNNVALGAINRAMPQLMVAFVGAPATVWSALALLALTAPTILAIWSEALDRLLAAPFGVP